MAEKFVHPYTKRALEEDSEGNLFCLEGDRREVFKGYDGCYDFAVANPDIWDKRDVYDKHYANWPTYKLTLAKIAEPWLDKTYPWRMTMLKSLGSLAGRRMLLLGNGMSYKEFYFVHLGARVVFTDLSLVASRRAQSVFRKSDLWEKNHENIEFHAVDATHLPFPDESFDVIYGTKFVGFVDNPTELFSEVHRCLKAGGICRFSDDAYSPTWNAISRTLLAPIRARFFWKSMSALNRIRSGGSPYGDYGFKEQSLIPFARQFGFSRFLFIRESFFLRFAQLAWGSLVRFDSKKLRYARPIYLMMKWLDDQLRNTSWMRRNQLGLTWGFDK